MATNYNNNEEGRTNNSSLGKGKILIKEGHRNYILNSEGYVTNCETGNILNEKSKKDGYKTVTMRDDQGKVKTYLLHRLIYEAFIGPIPEGKQINHIDEDRTNNKILFDEQGNITYTNLELVTPMENCNYGTRNKRISDNCKGKKKTKNSFKVIVTPFDGTQPSEEYYNSVKELCDAHPTQNRMTWYNRLFKSKKVLKLYPIIEGDNLLQIIPLNEEYQQRMNDYLKGDVE